MSEQLSIDGAPTFYDRHLTRAEAAEAYRALLMAPADRLFNAPSSIRGQIAMDTDERPTDTGTA